MANIIDQRLKELNIELDDASVPAGSYVPYVITNNLVFISGQLPFIDGKLTIKGKVGDNVSLDDAVKMSEACAKALLSQLKAACNGNLDKVNKVVKLGGFVASAPNFTDQPKVINGASDLIVNIFGDKGKHSRFAVGVAALPLNVPVEIDGIFEIED
ncbi:RidA family protein [Alphaproteobacteria bacterium]|jgi:enamine deaminase RidA (YjgF/YER057c/UK114 family)|uniref:RidA family protein n=1 Tax=Candidatus Levibacter sp. Uisw_134_01 TaxID=3230999 RepID=UPI000131FCF5|nr:RidA family protein [Alphaproteobacteria bacterium]MDA9565029.1 RidA family protein [Alphaproteobacteria bacterium]MDC0543495.1 RidA family protein [Alphaproteobacteria bacterium]